MIMITLRVSVLLLISTLATKGSSAGVTISCKSCQDIASPHDCRTTIDCGQNEICFTREIVDRYGYQGYRMGCENKDTCDLLKKAKILFGKRDLNSHKLCFDCCSSNECNGDICTQSTKGNVKTTSSSVTTFKPAAIETTTKAPSTKAQSSCPLGFTLHFGNSCYMISLDNLVWDDARKQCQSHSGSDLISINSAAEDTFIVKQLETLKPDDTIRGMWLGGTYDSQVDKYKWVDGTDLTFKRYMSGAPRMHNGYNLEVINPFLSKNDQFKGWPWNSDIGQFYQRGYICELKI